MPATMVMVALSLLVLLQLQEFLPASGGHLPQSQCTVVFPADHGRKLADGSKDYRTPTQNLRRRALQQDKEDEADANPDHETARGGKGGEDTQLPLKDEDEEDDEEGVDVDVDVDEDEDEDEGSRQQVTVLHAQDQQRHQQLNQEVREAQGPQPRRHLDSRETHNLIVNPTRMQQQPQQQGSSQLTVLMLSTFEDIRRALSSLSTIKMHLAPELVREGILLTPWRVSEWEGE
ncbi:hypothetical protein Vafri_18075 [Volvox africanus]|uniref:Uncharacterized protein n=1 Tax=Volvox africanus TaxID=51714 RepID=A0A8J4BLW3_9CHLO|nr:hypothetical protein Vafri_18075 [Volvox africanus]